MKDLHHNIKTVQTLDPAVTTENRAGSPVDRRGFESVEHIVLFGASDDTLSESVKVDVKLEASEDGSNWAAVIEDDAINGGPISAGGVFATIDSTSLDQMDYRIGYVGNARYSRVSLVLTGTHTNGTPISAKASATSRGSGRCGPPGGPASRWRPVPRRRGRARPRPVPARRDGVRRWASCPGV